MAQAGCGEYKILKQLQSVDLYQFDVIIVSHTSPYRLHTTHHPIHCKDPLHYNSDFLYSDVKAHKLSGIAEYFEYGFDLNYAEYIHSLICKDINNLLLDINQIHIAHIDCNNLDIFNNPINFNGIYKKNPGLINHYSDRGNLLVFQTLKEKLSKI